MLTLVITACQEVNRSTEMTRISDDPPEITLTAPAKIATPSKLAEPTAPSLTETPTLPLVSPLPDAPTVPPFHMPTATPEILTGELVFSSWREDVNKDGHIDGYDGAQLYILNIVSGELKQLTDAGYYDSSPVWSPDGESVAFISDRGGNDDLYVIDIGSGELTRLTDSSERESSPTWSPDGTRIVFQRTWTAKHGEWESGLFVLTMSDGIIEQLTNQPNNDSAPAWSPQGQYIAFTREGPVIEEDRTLYGSMVYLKKLDTGEEIRITEGIYEPGNTRLTEPRWPSCPEDDYLSLEQVPGEHSPATIFLFKLDWESSPPRLSKLVGINEVLGAPDSYVWADCINWLISPRLGPSGYSASLAALRLDTRFPRAQYIDDLTKQNSPILSLDNGWSLTGDVYSESWPDWKP